MMLPSIIQPIWTYLTMARDNYISIGQPVDICVHDGQFTNLLGAYYAKVSDGYILFSLRFI